MGIGITDEAVIPPWSFSGLLFELDRARDDEGRPVAERRAPSVAKTGVEMELRPAPYGDRRKGRAMNVSALAQIAKHFEGVLGDIARFYGALDQLLGPSEPSWDRMFLAVLDQLAGPAFATAPRGVRFRTEPASVVDGVSARRAVGHKLAAGYYGVMRDVLAREASGERIAVSPEAFMSVVDAGGWLVGQSEACAGPRPMIVRSTAGFLGGMRSEPTAEDIARARVILPLAAQIRIGISWQLFDTSVERAILVEPLGVERLKPRNAFMAREVASRREEHVSPPRGMRAVRHPLIPDWSLLHARPGDPQAPSVAGAALRRFGRLLENPSEAPEHRDLRELIPSLLDHGDGALQLLADPDRSTFAELCADYVIVEGAALAALEELELQIRAALGENYEGPFVASSTIFPPARARRWIEALLGHRVERTGLRLRFKNHRRAIELHP